MSETKVNNNKLVKMLLGVILVMSGFTFALVPLYEVFCEITGINGKVTGQALYQEVAVNQERTVTIEFVADVNRGLPWEFGTKTWSMEVHPGELNEVLFFAKNKSSKRIVGQAIPSLTPGESALYFNKTECFCFDQQTLAAGEHIEMPMKFYVDPDIPESIDTITLSYRLFNVTEQFSEQAAGR